jgi:hypothetical protein
MKTKAIEEAEEIISDQAIIIALQREELDELKAREQILLAQIRAMNNAQKVEYA